MTDIMPRMSIIRLGSCILCIHFKFSGVARVRQCAFTYTMTSNRLPQLSAYLHTYSPTRNAYISIHLTCPPFLQRLMRAYAFKRAKAWNRWLIHTCTYVQAAMIFPIPQLISFCDTNCRWTIRIAIISADLHQS